MIKRTLLFVLLLIASGQALLADVGCYVPLQDRSGLSASADLTGVVSAACDLKVILPEAWQRDFVVVEDAPYYLAEYFDVIVDSLEAHRYRQIESQYDAFLFVSRRVLVDGSQRFQAFLKLPESEDYPCLTPGLMQVLGRQTASAMNASVALRYTEREAYGLKFLKKQLDKAINCCSDEGKSAEDSCIPCDYSPLFGFGSKFQDFENLILSKEIRDRGFMALNNLQNIVYNTDTTHYFGIEASVRAEIRDLPGENYTNEASLRRVNLTEELIKISADYGSEVNIRVKVFDERNCSDLTQTLSKWTWPMGSDFVKEAYAEDIIVLSLGGETKIYSRFRSKSPELKRDFDIADSDDFGRLSGEDKVLLPIAAVVAQQLMKRALMGGVNVFIDVALSVAIEKIFHKVADNCEENSWGAAWNRYCDKASGWQLFISFVDGAVDNKLFTIFAGGLSAAVEYLLNPQNESFKSVGEFEVRIFFKRFASGASQTAATNIFFTLTKHGKAVVKKMRGDDLPPEVVNQLLGEVSALTPFFFKFRERGVRAFEQAFNRGVPDILRRNPDFLKPYSKALAERPKIGNHLKGHISPQGNAVGCHFPSAVDGVNVRLNPNQPSGFPTYFDPPASTKLKGNYSG